MKKLLTALTITPLTIASCGARNAKPPVAVEIPIPEDAKQKVIAEFNNAKQGITSTDTETWDELCDKYFDPSFETETKWFHISNGMKNCKDHHVRMADIDESMGVQSAIQSLDWRSMSGDDTDGWTISALIKVDSRITEWKTFDYLVTVLYETWYKLENKGSTQKEFEKLFTVPYRNRLKFGTLYTYKLIKSDETYKIKTFTAEPKTY